MLRPAICLILCVPLAPLPAQDSGAVATDLPVATSILAGFVTHAEGSVSIKGEPVDLESGELYQVQDGQRLTTGEPGHAELTLSLGSFVRVGQNTDLEMVNSGMRSAELRLHQGEVLADIPFLVDDQVSSLWIGEARVEFPKPGLYRVSADGGGAFSVDVMRGKAVVDSSGDETNVGKGKAFTRDAASNVSLEKAESADKAELVAWNEKRQQAWRENGSKRMDQVGSMSQLERLMMEMSMHRPRPTASSQPGMGGGGAGRSGGSGQSGGGKP